MRAEVKAADLVAGYGATVVLDGISFDLAAGGTLALLGRNGVGKSTLLNTLMGFTTLHRGTILLNGDAIESVASHRRNRLGLGYVPQEREIFPSLTVDENIAVASRPGGWSVEEIYALFPSLVERRRNAGDRLSGGEQQMLAIGRALAGAPQVLMLDEPTEGLAPVVVDALYDSLEHIRDHDGPTIILVEQKADMALAFAADAIVLDRGKIVYRGKSADLLREESLKAQLLGMGGYGDSAHGLKATQ
jgi:branched-chain amino acid transport system ATP-binding protein